MLLLSWQPEADGRRCIETMIAVIGTVSYIDVITDIPVIAVVNKIQANASRNVVRCFCSGNEIQSCDGITIRLEEEASMSADFAFVLIQCDLAVSIACFSYRKEWSFDRAFRHDMILLCLQWERHVKCIRRN